MNLDTFKIINFRYLLTPFATAYFVNREGIERKKYYLFGIRVTDISKYPPLYEKDLPLTSGGLFLII